MLNHDCFPLAAKMNVFSVLLFSPERPAVATGGVPWTDPEDVHRPGTDPDETGLQHEGRYGAPQTRQEEWVRGGRRLSAVTRFRAKGTLLHKNQCGSPFFVLSVIPILRRSVHTKHKKPLLCHSFPFVLRSFESVPLVVLHCCGIARVSSSCTTRLKNTLRVF